MASRRDLKKDIRFLAEDLYTNCYLKQVLFDHVSREKIAEIILETMEYQNQFTARVNHPDGKDNPKLVRTYYQCLRKDLLAGYQTLANKLNAL